MKSAGILVTLSTGVSVSDGDTILWDDVVRDEGQNFDPKTGAYIVPLDGTYLIHAQVGNTYCKKTNKKTLLRKNKQTKTSKQKSNKNK